MRYQTALTMAIKMNHGEIIKLLLTNDKLDINLPYVLF
mgnify:CR=1 FL=1